MSLVLTKVECDFLATLPNDGSLMVISKDQYQLASDLHVRGLCFLINHLWPDMACCITYWGRKALSRA